MNTAAEAYYTGVGIYSTAVEIAIVQLQLAIVKESGVTVSY